MSIEALQLYKEKLQPGRCSIFCWSLLILIALPIAFVFQGQFLTQIPFFFPSETQPANCRNHLRGFYLSPLGFSSPTLSFPLISSSTSVLGSHLCVISQLHILISILRQLPVCHISPQNLFYSYYHLISFGSQISSCPFILSFPSYVPNPPFFPLLAPIHDLFAYSVLVLAPVELSASFFSDESICCCM